MGLFFEVRFDFVAPGRSREIGRGLQVSKPLGFLVDPNDNERALRLINGAPAEFGLCLLTKICSGVKLESLRSNKKGDTQKQDFAVPDQEPRIFWTDLPPPWLPPSLTD